MLAGGLAYAAIDIVGDAMLRRHWRKASPATRAKRKRRARRFFLVLVGTGLAAMIALTIFTVVAFEEEGIRGLVGALVGLGLCLLLLIAVLMDD